MSSSAHQNYEQPPRTSQNSVFQVLFFCEKYWTRRPTFIKKCSLKFWFLKHIIFQNRAQFLSVLFIILACLMMTRFSEKNVYLHMVSCRTWSKNLGRTLMHTLPLSKLHFKFDELPTGRWIVLSFCKAWQKLQKKIVQICILAWPCAVEFCEQKLFIEKCFY